MKARNLTDRDISFTQNIVIIERIIEKIHQVKFEIQKNAGKGKIKLLGKEKNNQIFSFQSVFMIGI